MLVFSFVVFVLLIAIFFKKNKITEDEKEIMNRFDWQREVYGFEFYAYETAKGLRIGKHRKNSTKEQDERWVRDRTNKAIKKSYAEWKKGRGL